MPLRLFGRSTPQEPSLAEVHEQSTLAIPEVLEWLESLRQPTILDFGSAVHENFTLFSSYGGQLEILDLFARLADSVSQTRHAIPENDVAQVLRARLERSEVRPTAEGGGFDLILTWDHFDYLTLGQIGAAFRSLEPFRRPGTRTFAMLSYVGQLPLIPRRLKIAAPDRLQWEADPPRKRPSPRHNEPDVRRHLRHTQVVSSHLMRHGARELVFEDLATVGS